jgi:hypothetical protein
LCFGGMWWKLSQGWGVRKFLMYLLKVLIFKIRQSHFCYFTKCLK